MLTPYNNTAPMHIIKNCTACSKRLRFPIDRGIIRVRCACGNEFIADPDKPGLYENSQFDLSTNKAALKGDARRFINNLKLDELYPKIINKLYGFKYKLQNFKLLPSSEQKKIIIPLLLIFFILAAVIFMICSGADAPKEIKDPMVI